MKNTTLRIISAILCVMMISALMIGSSAAAGAAGDVNRDGKVNNKDVTVLFRYLNGSGVSVDKKACDTDGDGEENNKDAVTLFRYLSGVPGAVIYYGKEEAMEKELSSEIKLENYDFLTQESSDTYTYDGTPGSFGLYLTAKNSGATVTLPGGDVSGVYPAFSMSADKTTVYKFYLKCAITDPTYGWFTCYFGLRLANSHEDATNSNGVWIAMRNSEIGLLTESWPQTKYVAASCDFSKGVLLTVKDDPANNKIYVYAGENETQIASISISANNVVLTNTSNKTVSVTTSNNVIKGGYAHIWAHIPDNDVIVKDLSVTTSRSTGVVDNDGIKNNTRDIFSDTWVAYDDNGREILTSQTKPNGTKVGMFYFLWHEDKYNRYQLYDHTASYLNGGIDALWNTMTSGSLGFAHYWAEPYFGYYSSNDEWVIRKHGAMLSEAGVDFIFFDATNGLLYNKNYEAVLRVWAKMRGEGLKTPDVCFLMQENNTNELSDLWSNLYSVGLYEDLWFKWNGKPVIMFTGRNNTLTDEQNNFFTVRYSWANENDAWYTNNSYNINNRGINCWAWGTMYPQKGGYVMVNGKRTLEQMVVMCGFWVNGSYGTNAGRSYTYKTGEPKTSTNWDMGYALFPETSGKGLAYQEQFDYALRKSPKLMMITGWNEWWAGRWEGGAAVGQKIANEYTVSSDSSVKEYNYYVDNLNPEYSRDLEPMKDGFKDNYYYQTVMNVRNYKGTRRTETAFGQKTIDLDGSVAQWNTVGPEYRDVYGDTAERNHKSFVGKMTYKNSTGRNDILTAKVSQDGTYLYFYVECAEDITKPDGENWMNLFIKSDDNDDNGWYGFDYVINRQRTDNSTSVMRFDNGWQFTKVGDAQYSLDGKSLTVKVKKSLINYNGKTLDFKWADNSVNDGDIMQFLDLGDAAPDGRFCYRYTTEQSQTVIPDCLTNDMAVFKVNGYNAFINGRSVRLNGNNTKAVLVASGYEFYLPVSTLESLGITCTDEIKYNHYGVQYVRADQLIKNSGKAVTITPDGLLVISNSKITDTEILDTLYRSLY
ncbi:MAG: hypothetical protein IJT49_05325 [Clostridia bacterium]|nr:hypothetical protein [Clostridia bacterium]